MVRQGTQDQAKSLGIYLGQRGMLSNAGQI